MDQNMRFVLFQPDIAPNVGTILRLASCLHIDVDIIEPCGFPWDSKALNRSALDYKEHAFVKRYSSWSEYIKTDHQQILESSKNSVCEQNKGQTLYDIESRLVLLTTKSKIPYYKFDFKANDRIMVGRETAGVPNDVHLAAHKRLIIPMKPKRRSLNVAIALAIATGEALRQTNLYREKNE